MCAVHSAMVTVAQGRNRSHGEEKGDGGHEDSEDGGQVDSTANNEKTDSVTTI